MKTGQNVYLRLFGYLLRHIPHLLLGYAAMLASLLINLLVPQVVKSAIDRGLAAGNVSALIVSAGLILGIAAIRLSLIHI